MKKKYIYPCITQTHSEVTHCLCSNSGVRADGIDYGGRDDEGSMDPAARQREDEEFEMINILIEMENQNGQNGIW